MKIGVISDLHLGHRQYGLIEREEDFYIQFKKVIEKLNTLECDIVIIAGDIFHTANPSPKSIHIYEQCIFDLNADAVLAIQGNHTMLLRDNHYPIDKYFADSEIEGYTLLEDDIWTTIDYAFDSKYDDEFAKYHNAPRIRVDGMRYYYDSELDEFILKQHELAQNPKEEDALRILVVHQAFKEYCGFSNVDLSIYDLDLDKYSIIICGHIHNHVFDSKGWFFLQPGSMERLNTAEARDEIKNQKGVWTIDVTQSDVDRQDFKVEFHPIEFDRKFFIGDMHIHSVDEIKQHIDNLIEETNNISLPSLVSYNYYDEADISDIIKDEMLRLSKDGNVLKDNSNVFLKSQVDMGIDIGENEIPTITQAIWNSNVDFTDDEKNLAVELHDSFKNSEENVKTLLENFRKKHFSKKTINSYDTRDEELAELEKYFDSL